MAATNVRGRQLKDDDVLRADLNTTVSGSAVIRRVFSGAGVALSSTGVDSGTGDVTITLSASGVTAGSYGSSTLVPIVTVDTYGRVTSITTATISGGGGGGSSVRCEQTITATANQTLFSGLTCTLTSGYFDVFVNGVKVNSASFSNTSNSITFVDGLAAGDIVDIVNYGIFSTSVTTANGFTGTVANATTTPAITLSTSVNGIIKGSGGSLVAAVAGTDFQFPITLTTTGSSGAASFSSNTLNIPTYTLAGLGGQPGSANLTSLSGLTFASTSFVKMTAVGTFALDTNAYALTNQTMFIGTTSVAINRASASLSLTGVSIDGNAGTVTNGVYTTGNQTIGGSKTFSSALTTTSIICTSYTVDQFLFVSAASGQVISTSKMKYVLSANAQLDPVVTLGVGTDAPQIKFNYLAGGDFTGQLVGADQMSFGFNNAAAYEGIAGVASGRTIYFYDRVSTAYILGATPTKVFIGPSGTNYGLSVARPNANIRGISVLATGQVQFNTYTSSTSFTGTSVANLAVDSSGNIITVAASGTVTSVGMTVPTGLSVSPASITTSGTFAVTFTAGYSIPTTASQTNWDSAFSERRQWDGGSTNLVAATGRTSLGATTVGSNLFTLANPTAVTFLRINADNTVSTLDAATFRTAIGAGTSSTTGTVTSVALSLPAIFSVSGSPVTSSGTLTAQFLNQNAGFVLAGPTSGLQTTPTFRALVATDIPTLNQNTTGSAGSVVNSFVVRADSGTTEGTDIYTFNGSAAKNINIVAGTNVTITKAAGQWTIAAAGGTTLNGTGFVRMSGTTVSYVTGTASQFVKADGTLDSTSYQTALTNPVTGTGTSGQVSYWSGTSAQTGSANFVYDAANVRVNLGGAPTGFLNTTNVNILGSTTLVGVTVRNPSAATGATQAGFYLENIDSNAQLYKAGRNYTTYKIITADDLGFYNAVAGDISILNDYSAGQILFAAGGSNTAHLTIGTTGASTFSNNVTAAQFIRSGGTASQFLKANGSIDSTAYLALTGGTLTGALSGTSITLSSTLTTNGNVIFQGAPGTAGTIEFYPTGGSSATYTVLKARLGSGLAPTLAFYGDVAGVHKGYGIYGADSTYDGLLVYRETGSVVDVMFMGANQVSLPSTQKIAWASTSNSVGTLDLGIARNAAGVLEINNGTVGTMASLRFLGATVTGLAGAGTRMVVADANGVLSTQSIPGGGGGSSAYVVTSQTANYTETATSGTKIILCNTTGGAFTVTLPTAVGNTATLIIKKTAGTPILTIDGAGTETIDGDLTALIYDPEESITLISDNANWLII